MQSADKAAARTALGATATGQAAITAAHAAALATAAGLGAVDNTSDADKPVSTAQQAALDVLTNTIRVSSAGRAGVYADGSDEAISIPHATSLDPGILDFSVVGTFALADWRPTAPVVLAQKADDSDPTSATDGWILRCESDGSIALYVGGTTTPVAQTDPIDTDLAVAYVPLDITVTINRNEQEVLFWIGAELLKAVDVSATLDTSVSLSSANPLIVLDGASGWTLGYFILADRWLTQSELAAMQRNPDVALRLAGADVFASDFSANANLFTTTSNATSAGNIDGIGGLNDVLRLTVGANATESRVLRTNVLTANVPQTIFARVYVPSTNTEVDGVRIRTGPGTQFNTDSTPTPNEWTWIQASGNPVTSLHVGLVALAAGGNPTAAAENDVVYFRDVTVVRTGTKLLIDLTEAGVTKSDLIGSNNATRGTNAEDTIQ